MDYTVILLKHSILEAISINASGTEYMPYEPPP
jgi:hypothetical protein